jgi:beta-lactamase regulating signal transducer with metallopeptidase domain
MEEGGLDALALEVVLDHERSHAAHKDNWKLLSLYCLPRLGLRVSGGQRWIQLWQNAAEWAADEDAVGSNRARALALAETLVALARSVAKPEPGIACTNFVCAETELALRVERLIECRVEAFAPVDGMIMAAFGCVVLVGVVVLMNYSALLREVPEHLLHLG